MLNMSISWVYAFFFLMPLCRAIGPQHDFGDLACICACICRNKSKVEE